MLLKAVTLLGLVLAGGTIANRAGGNDPVSVPAPPVTDRAGLSTATFAGGCFWSVEKFFQETEGVVHATSGFMGGDLKNPSYQQVITGTTGHLEAVEVVFDPTKVSYQQLLDKYWHNTDPTHPNGQFCDFGPQYRTAIFYNDENQRVQAEESRRKLDASKQLPRPIVTRIQPAGEFYPAEEYHQDFYKKNPVHCNSYPIGCGRDRQLKALWGDQQHSAH